MLKLAKGRISNVFRFFYVFLVLSLFMFLLVAVTDFLFFYLYFSSFLLDFELGCSILAEFIGP